MRRTPRSVAVIACAAALAITACNGDDSAAPADEPTEEPADAAREPAPDEPASESSDEPAEEPAEVPTDDAPVDSADDADDQEPIDEEPAEPEPIDQEPVDPEPAGEEPGDPGEPTVDGDTILVAGVDQLPDECVDRVAEMLREIEPAVSQVDWDTATLDDLDTAMLEFEDEFEALDDDERASGCSRYEFEDESASFEAMLEIAETEAPGVVGWLTFVQTVFSSMSGGDGAAPVDGPTDCEGAIAFLDELVAGGGTMSSLPVSELAVVSHAFTVLTEDCALDVMNEFMERPEVAAFLS